MRVSRRYQFEFRHPVERLQGCGRAGEITMPHSLIEDPVAAELLRNQAVDTRAIELKGCERPQPAVGFSPVVQMPSRAAAGDAG
ncbi:MAG: hypothetical protein QNJ85_03070 [Gammaproteobacteria bacterium]|nr:hypothetical protein [Gammaproteobacteria bacterium]